MATEESHTYLVFDRTRQMIGILAATENERLRLCHIQGWSMYTPNETPAQFRSMASAHAGIAATIAKGS